MNQFSKVEAELTKGWHNIQMAISTFIRATNRSYSIQNWPKIIVTAANDDFCAALERPILLRNWPYRSCSNKKKFHIAIDGTFTCQRHQQHKIELLSYYTWIAYFQPRSMTNNKNVIPIDGYHFDMAASIQRTHPVFHVQRNEKVLIDKLDSLDLNLEEQPPNSTLHHVHLPTPQVDIYSALIMIIADHIVCDQQSEKEFFILTEKARKHIPLKANLDSQAHLNQCIENEDLLLHHWYAPKVTT